MRLQIELPEDRVQYLKSLMEVANIDTYKQLFNISISILEWALREKSRGRIIASMDEGDGSYKELILPIPGFPDEITAKNLRIHIPGLRGEITAESESRQQEQQELQALKNAQRRARGLMDTGG